MDLMSVVLLILVGLTLLVLYRLDLLPGWNHRITSSNDERKNPYPAVSIRCAGGCEAAQNLKGHRFLGNEAPALPLETCSAQTCSCRYVHHVDRRTGILDRRGKQADSHADSHADSRADNEQAPSQPGVEDQREGRGRRASDWIAAYQLNIPQV